MEAKSGWEEVVPHHTVMGDGRASLFVEDVSAGLAASLCWLACVQHRDISF